LFFNRHGEKKKRDPNSIKIKGIVTSPKKTRLPSSIKRGGGKKNFQFASPRKKSLREKKSRYLLQKIKRFGSEKKRENSNPLKTPMEEGRNDYSPREAISAPKEEGEKKKSSEDPEKVQQRKIGTFPSREKKGETEDMFV